MQNQKRKIEVFTAGCALCNGTLKLLQEAVTSCGCEVIERRCEGVEQCEDANRYGVKAMPAVVVNGELIFEGHITRAQAALLMR